MSRVARPRTARPIDVSARKGGRPAGIALGFGRAWVANTDGSLTVIIQATFGVVQTVALTRGTKPRGVAITGEGG